MKRKPPTATLPVDATVEVLDQFVAAIDDETPQVLADVMERLFDAGALDVTLSPLTMKKSRPGVRLEVLSPPARRETMTALILAHSSTLGVRRSDVERTSLAREFVKVRVRGKDVRVKVAIWNGRPLRGMPEYEDCRRVAKAAGVPVREVMEEARHASADRTAQGRRGRGR